MYIFWKHLFSGRNKKETMYCYNTREKRLAIDKLGSNPEITRFKGLGEISPNEFKNFINENIKIEPVIFKGNTSINEVLLYYMGKNTPERQKFIIENLRFEE